MGAEHDGEDGAPSPTAEMGGRDRTASMFAEFSGVDKASAKGHVEQFKLQGLSTLEAMLETFFDPAFEASAGVDGTTDAPVKPTPPGWVATRADSSLSDGMPPEGGVVRQASSTVGPLSARSSGASGRSSRSNDDEWVPAGPPASASWPSCAAHSNGSQRSANVSQRSASSSVSSSADAQGATADIGADPLTDISEGIEPTSVEPTVNFDSVLRTVNSGALDLSAIDGAPTPPDPFPAPSGSPPITPRLGGNGRARSSSDPKRRSLVSRAFGFGKPKR
jgi:hypothetical protein